MLVLVLVFEFSSFLRLRPLSAAFEYECGDFCEQSAGVQRTEWTGQGWGLCRFGDWQLPAVQNILFLQSGAWAGRPGFRLCSCADTGGF